MKLYLSTIGISMIIIAASNIAIETASWYYVIFAVTWCTVLAFMLDAAIAIIVNKMPDRWFGAYNPLFNVSNREKELYKILRVRLWKDKVWELGGLGRFSKRKLLEPDNPTYIEKFVIECNKGVVTHTLSYPVGFVTMLPVFTTCSFTIALPVATVNLYLNILPTIALRYNTPKLKNLLSRLKRQSPDNNVNLEKQATN